MNMLFRLDPDGRLAALDLRGRGVRVSPDGRRLASWTAQDILVHDFDLGETNQLLNRRQSWYPVWSRDGERIFFSDLADGYRGVFEISSNGGDRQTVVTLDGPSIPTSIAPDGTIMGYRIHPETNRDIWTFSPAGELSMVLATRHNERAGAISPDGSWFAYVSDEEGGDEIYLRQFPDSGRKWRVSPAGGVAPVWSRDGGELLYRLGDLIYAISIERSGSAPRIGTPSELYSSDRVYIDRFGNPTLDTTPDGSIILPLTEPSDVRTRVVLNWQP